MPMPQTRDASRRTVVTTNPPMYGDPRLLVLAAYHAAPMSDIPCFSPRVIVLAPALSLAVFPVLAPNVAGGARLAPMTMKTMKKRCCERPLMGRIRLASAGSALPTRLLSLDCAMRGVCQEAGARTLRQRTAARPSMVRAWRSLEKSQIPMSRVTKTDLRALVIGQLRLIREHGASAVAWSRLIWWIGVPSLLHQWCPQ